MPSDVSSDLSVFDRFPLKPAISPLAPWFFVLCVLLVAIVGTVLPQCHFRQPVRPDGSHGRRPSRVVWALR